MLSFCLCLPTIHDALLPLDHSSVDFASTPQQTCPGVHVMRTVFSREPRVTCFVWPRILISFHTTPEPPETEYPRRETIVSLRNGSGVNTGFHIYMIRKYSISHIFWFRLILICVSFLVITEGLIRSSDWCVLAAWAGVCTVELDVVTWEHQVPF